MASIQTRPGPDKFATRMHRGRAFSVQKIVFCTTDNEPSKAPITNNEKNSLFAAQRVHCRKHAAREDYEAEVHVSGSDNVK